VILGFCHKVDDICALRAYYAAYGDNSLLTFWDNLLVLDLTTLEDGTDGLSRKFDKELPPYAV
jgi:hypothetical protein